jgi:glucose dehydrogenase
MDVGLVDALCDYSRPVFLFGACPTRPHKKATHNLNFVSTPHHRRSPKSAAASIWLYTRAPQPAAAPRYSRHNLHRRHPMGGGLSFADCAWADLLVVAAHFIAAKKMPSAASRIGYFSPDTLQYCQKNFQNRTHTLRSMPTPTPTPCGLPALSSPSLTNQPPPSPPPYI